MPNSTTACGCVVQWKDAATISDATARRAAVCNCLATDAAGARTFTLATTADNVVSATGTFKSTSFTTISDAKHGIVADKTQTVGKDAVVTMSWYQPKDASTYTGLPRFSKDDWVNAYPAGAT